MSIDQGTPEPAADPGSAGPAVPPPAGPAVPPPAAPYGVPPQQPATTTNGFAIAGFVLAFLIAPLGLIFSIVGVVSAGRRGQRGRGLAVAGILISLLITVGATVGAFLAYQTVDKLADPGCVAGKDVILNKGAAADTPEKVQAVIDGLNAASAKATHADVRAAMKALATDYTTLFQEAQAGKQDQAILDRITADGTAIDKVCTLNVN